MRKLKAVLQVIVAFVIALLAFVGFYTPHQDTVRAAVRQKVPQIAEEQKPEVAQGKLKITVLNVGHGDAILMQTDKQTVLVDTGDYKEKQTLINRLTALGVKRINTVVITHHHSDHMGNVMTIAGKYGVHKICDNGVVNSKYATSVKLDGILRKGNYNNRVLQAGDTLYLDKGFYLEVLSPGPFLDKKALHNQNNNSLAFKLHYGKFTMMFTGDIENPVEVALAAKYGDGLKSDVLKVAHHGSKTSSNYRFISRVKPQYALISCGEFEIYHHPSPNTVGALTHLGAKVYTTHNNGNLTVLTDGNSFNVTPER